MYSRWMKRVLLIAALLFPAGLVSAQEGEIPLLQSGTDINNVESLQRGARNFMNYCSGCQSLKYVRYNRMGTDLHIPDTELVKNLMFTTDRVFEGVNLAMSPTDSEGWFGKQPPDLPLMARERGVDSI